MPVENLRTSMDQIKQAKKACISCQRRKRWCDRTLPACLRCSRLRRECGGYEPELIRTFVNMDATNIAHPRKKRLLCEALAKSKDASVHHFPPESCHLSSNQNALLLSGEDSRSTIVVPTSLQNDCSQQLEVLWRNFISRYCLTKDYWPPGCLSLALQSSVLDLALVALSAQHLALDFPRSDLRVLGLTAYNKSVGLYRPLLQGPSNSSSLAILAVTSTIYALMEASLMQPQDITYFGWGKSGHFDGALASMVRSGPHVFSTVGFHLVFKKIREMGVFLALAREQKTFLSEQDWITIPWSLYPKSWRDKLYDLVISFNKVTTSSRQYGRTPDSESAITLIDNVLGIEANLRLWKALWLKETNSQNVDNCNCLSPEPLSCICSIPESDFSAVDLALLQLECWALQLLISIKLDKLLIHNHHHLTPLAAQVLERASRLARNIENVLGVPKGIWIEKQSSGITENECRAILASWALNEYRKGYT